MKRAIVSVLVFLVVCALCAFALKSILSDGSIPISSSQTSGSSLQGSSLSSSDVAYSSDESTSYSEPTTEIETFEYPEEIPSTYEEMADMWRSPEPDFPVLDSYADEITVAGSISMPPVTNETPLEKLLFVTGMNTVIETNANCDDRWTINEYRLLRSYTEQANQYRPVNFLRQTQPGCYYTVQKVENSGYVYLFYARNRNSDGEYVTEDLTDVYRIGCVYLEKVFQKSDFDSIQIGSTIDEVMAIDNAASITKIWAETYEICSGEKSDSVLSKHLLKDGLLVYKYGYEGDTLVVTEIIFSEDFIFNCSVIIDYETGETKNYPKYFGILPQDYPQ